MFPNFLHCPDINKDQIMRAFLQRVLCVCVGGGVAVAPVPRVVGPYFFNADPDPAFHLNANPDPARAFKPPLWASTALYGFIFLSFVAS